MVTLILVIVVVSLLILVHEWGHFYSARKLGVKVEEFGFGFPPKVISRVKSGVRYSFNLFPFGGFVKIFGEHGEGEESKESFISRPAWQRFIILAAGVGMNFFLAWVFFSAGAAMGLPQIADEKTDNIPVSIFSVLPASPAEHAGLRFGDQILEMRAAGLSLRVEKEADVRDFADAYRGEEIIMVMRRGADIQEVRLTPRPETPDGEGPIGVSLGRLTVRRVPFYRAPVEGILLLSRSTAATVEGLWTIVLEIVRDGKVSREVSGPVGIFFFAKDMQLLGIAYFLQFIAILSVNLTVLNFLPIPALDGGRIFFLVIEKIRRKRMDPKIENAIHMAGFALLILLMMVVTYRDVARIF